MLDENLPTFIFRPMPEHPHSAVVYFTRSGSDPAPEYVLRLADPATQPACRGVYAAALTDPYNSSNVIYGEVAVQPDWQQPSLSAAELREQRERRERQGADADAAAAAAAAAPIPKVPETFAIQLYNPDQAVTVRWTPGSWNKTESWEFSMPTQSFRVPSASRLDREDQASATGGGGAAGGGGGAGGAGAGVDPLAPRTTFRWKRDGRLGNKDMTCFMLGRASGGGSGGGGSGSSSHRSKEPDITVALFKHSRDPSVTIYEPNLHRVDVQDRKGLELVLLLGATVVRDLYLAPRGDPFHLEGAAAARTGRQRQNSRPAPQSAAAAQPLPPPPRTATVYNAPATAAGAPPPSSTPSAAAIDAETKRLQAMLEREERERARRLQEEERRIKKMLEAEEKEQRRRDAEVAKETERLRKMYGVAGQELPSAPASAAHYPVAPYQPQPTLPPRPVSAVPPRPVSAGPRPDGALSSLHAWWHNTNNSASSSGHGRRRNGGQSSSSAAQRDMMTPAIPRSVESDRNRVQKKRSVYF